jgi:hypothetical protein
MAKGLLDDEELRRFNAIESQGQPFYKVGFPMEGRSLLFPFKDSMPGSVFNERSAALPGLLAGALNYFTAPERARTGSDPTFNPTEEAINMAFNTFGGGIATGKALRNPTGQGGVDLAMSYLANTPKKPNPVVGTRYETENLGGLLDKNPVNLENYRGGSLMVMPWDSTSRNVAIKSVSDVELPSQVITHGGQDYARDVAHQAQGIVGASGEAIAKRIRDREVQAIKENLEAGGTGKILHLPITMGDFAENFSVMPAQALLGILDKAKPTKASLKELNNSIRNFSPDKKDLTFKPFKNFKGVETEQGRIQLMTGEGLESTAGEIRKAFVNRMYLKGNQEKFGFNAEDIVRAVSDPALIGVPKGYAGNTVIESSLTGMQLKPSNNPTYNTDFTGNYVGTLGQSVPVEQLMPKRFSAISQEMSGKQGDLRTHVIGALEKRKAGVSEFIDDQLLESLIKYLQPYR